MQSFSAIRDTTNPYLAQLWDSIGGQVVPLTFSWRDAVLGRFDVLHVHWPELLLRSGSPLKRWLRRVLLLVVLLRIRTGPRALVRTVHNLRPHEEGNRTERALLRLFDRWTTLFVTLVPSTPLPVPGAARAVIAHGDYTQWFAGLDVPAQVPGRLGYVGLLRSYKGVDVLLHEFAALSGDGLSLRVVGKAQDPAIAAQVTAAVAADRRISARLEYVDDPTMAVEIGRSALVVLPYRAMHNSGAALLALSLGRPILVPDNEINRDLAAEVGPGWVHLFDGELTAGALAGALAAVAENDRSDAPDLSARQWDAVGAAHVEGYRAALRIVLERRRKR
ncbi:glycosyltransferase [Nakamurella sp. YIM 132087]|uniref:Glycosyltransferase n=1 Tax=Nakamurella alba TaxID=2665158 RepID=A0A7K1FF96_9ACTN|nr:glycosyltransferase [Nakamurella alba]MTD12750.1 glycosyltransferase [Nakamurella alba]